MGLVRRDLIVPDRSLLLGDDAFRFRHLLIRDAAYDAAPKALRAQLHERFATWLIEVAGDHIAEQEEIVAYHLERAYRLLEELGPVDDEARDIALRAADRYRACGRRAGDRGDEPGAATLYRHVVDLLPDGNPDHPRAVFDLGHALLNAFEAPEALAVATEALEAAAAAGDESLEWMARIDRSQAQLLVDPHARSTADVREEFLQALETFDRLGNERGLAETWLAMTEVAWMSCSFDDAAVQAERAAENARAIGDRRLLRNALMKKQAAEMFGSTMPDDALRSAEAMTAEIGQDGMLGAISAVHRAVYASYQGDFDRARLLCDEGTAMAEELGSRFMIAASSGIRGQLELLAGDASAAEHFARREHDILLALGDDGHRSTAAGELAMVLCDLGRLSEAESLANEAMSLAADDDLASQAFGRIALARVRTARGLDDDAVSLAREAVELYAAAQTPDQSGKTWTALAEALRAAGREAEATAAAETAVAFYERKGNRPAAERTRAFLDESDV
jgi:tetratricopeptide (TPR) repeat protein